jgi:hypothetical protein
LIVKKEPRAFCAAQPSVLNTHERVLAWIFVLAFVLLRFVFLLALVSVLRYSLFI